MTAERVPMSTLREVVRMKLEMKLSGRAIARGTGLSPATVSGYLGRLEIAKLEWPLPAELEDDDALRRRLFPQEGHPVTSRPEPEWCVIHQELKRKHVTKSLLWLEYREANPTGYQRLIAVDGKHVLEVDFHLPSVALRRHLRAQETPPPPIVFEGEPSV